MTPTVASSVMSNLKAGLGDLLGLGVAWALIFIGAHGLLALFLVIAMATLLSWISWLGPGKTHIRFGAAFLFLSGGSEPEAFSLGSALGLAANLIRPPGNSHTSREAAVAQFAKCGSTTGDFNAERFELHVLQTIIWELYQITVIPSALMNPESDHREIQKTFDYLSDTHKSTITSQSSSLPAREWVYTAIHSLRTIVQLFPQNIPK